MAKAGDGTGVGFVGAGKMATALARGFVSAGLVAAESIRACDVVPAACRAFSEAVAARIVPSAAAVLAECDVVFLAVKPQQMGDVLGEIRPHVASRHLIVSIAAGVPLERLGAGIGTGARIVRVMPNTPCLLGCGASGFARGGGATSEDGATVLRFLSTVGYACELPERLLDAVTGLSGSGPAYGYLMIEALADGGVRVGLPRDVALRLAAQTLLGAARMVLETGEHPGALKDAVASPGGTTIAGLHTLERGGLRGVLMSAVEAATQRSAELGRG